MADIIIPDVPDDVIAAVDVKALRLGLSRDSFLRRVLVGGSFEQAGPGPLGHQSAMVTLDDSRPNDNPSCRCTTAGEPRVAVSELSGSAEPSLALQVRARRR